MIHLYMFINKYTITAVVILAALIATLLVVIPTNTQAIGIPSPCETASNKYIRYIFRNGDNLTYADRRYTNEHYKAAGTTTQDVPVKVRLQHIRSQILNFPDTITYCVATEPQYPPYYTTAGGGISYAILGVPTSATVPSGAVVIPNTVSITLTIDWEVKNCPAYDIFWSGGRGNKDSTTYRKCATQKFVSNLAGSDGCFSPSERASAITEINNSNTVVDKAFGYRVFRNRWCD